MPSLKPSPIIRKCLRSSPPKSPSSRHSISISPREIFSHPTSHDAYARLPSRRLISLHGPDAHHFLQGLVSSNIPPSTFPTVSSGHYSAFLNASGRVLYDVFIYPAAHSQQYRDAVLDGKRFIPGLLIEVDATEVENLAKHLKRFRLRAKLGIEVMKEDEWDVWSVWPNATSSLLHANDIWCHDNRAPGMGHRIIRPRKYAPKAEHEVTSERYDLNRIMKGVAEGQQEIVKESALPQESNIDYMGGIDFRKGCYVGQELTIRTHHTGVVRKRILPVQLYKGPTPPNEMSYNPNPELMLPSRGANISRVDKKGRSAGRWLGGVGNVGLALCRLEIMTDTVLTSEGNQWSPEHEFKVAWEPEEDRAGGEVGIKAFVPEWHRERAEALGAHRR